MGCQIAQITALSLGGPAPEALGLNASDPKPFRVSIDTTDDKSLKKAKRIMDSAGFTLEIPKLDGLPKPDRKSSSNENYRKGIVFRDQLAVNVKITRDKTATSEERTWESNLVIPDPTSQYVFDMSRALFVNKVQNLTFSNGMLTSSRVNKPSEIVGALSIPRSILTTLLPLPAQRDAARLAELQAQNSIRQLTADPTELERLNAEIELLRARNTLNELQGGGN